VSFRTLLKAIAGLLLAAVLIAIVCLLCLLVPDYWLAISLISFAGLVVLVCLSARKFKETEGESGVVAYVDYYDVFKCLSVIMVPMVIIFFSLPFINQINSILICVGLYISLMLIHIAYRTAQDNSFIMLPVVLLVKIGLSVIWVTVFYQMLNPAGKTRKSRRTTRTMAIFATMMVAPLIHILVLGDDGKEMLRARLHDRPFTGPL